MTFSNPSEFDESRPSSSSPSEELESQSPGESAAEDVSKAEQAVAVAGGQSEDQAEGEAPKPSLEYEYAVEEVEPCKRRVLVTIPQREVRRVFSEELREIKDTAAVPGFRPGHVPRRLLERRYWVELKDSLKLKLMLQAFEDLSDKKAFTPISDPDLDLQTVELPDDGDFVFEFGIEVRPRFTMENWKGLRITKPIFQVSDAFRQQHYRRALERLGAIVDVEGPAEMGDYVVADVTLRQGERVINSAECEKIRIRPKLSFFDGTAEKFGEIMVGVQSGETRTCEVAVSPECRDPELAGKTVEAVFKVRAVHRSDVERAAQLLGSTVEHFIESNRESWDLQINKAMQQRQAEELRTQVLDQLLGQVHFDLPRGLVKKQTSREVRRMALELQSQGYSPDVIQAQINWLHRDAGVRVDRLLREHFLLEQLAEQEGIDVSEQDLDREIVQIAEQSNESPRRVRARIEQENSWDVLRNQVIERKVIERVLEFAEIEEEVRNLEEDTASEMEFALSTSIARTLGEESASDEAQGEDA